LALWRRGGGTGENYTAYGELDTQSRDRASNDYRAQRRAQAGRRAGRQRKAPRQGFTKRKNLSCIGPRKKNSIVRNHDRKKRLNNSDAKESEMQNRSVRRLIVLEEAKSGP